MNRRLLRVMFVTDALHPVGGVEMVLGRILGLLDRQAFRPSLTVLGPCHPDEMPVPQDIGVRYLGQRHVRNAARRLTRAIVNDQPDVVCALKTHTNVIAALANRQAGRPASVIVCEHSHLSGRLQNQPIHRRCKWHFTLLLGQCIYRHSVDKAVFVSDAALRDGCKKLKLPRARATVVHNPVVAGDLLELSREEVMHDWFTGQGDRPTILVVGRLTRSKGLPHLMQAFSRVTSSVPARLVFLGSGEERDSLCSLARQLQVEENVAFLGFQPNPYKFMSRAQVYVLSSLWEGLPTTLIEAMACGAPVIATRCPSGPEETITDGVDGLLVPPADSAALAEAIVKVLTNPSLARRLSAAGQRRAADFGVEKAVAQYERLFQAVVAAGEGR